MNENRLFSTISNIDEELINEAVNASRKKKLPALRITASVAAFASIALVAVIIVNINKQQNMISETGTANVQTSEKADSDMTESKKHNSENIPTAQPGKQTAIEQLIDDNECLEYLKEPAFIIWNDNSYMQAFNDREYTPDKDIGRVGDFDDFYSGFDDDSRVYTVKEDDKVLLVIFETGDSVTLMLDSLGYCNFNGLRVDNSLMAVLLSADDEKAYSVYVTRPDSDDMYDYVYNGKTLNQMKEKLYESWKTSDSKINSLETEYNEALHAFLKEKIETVYDILKENGIQSQLINEVSCEMTISKEQFETLAASGSIPYEYAFGLSSGGYVTDDESGLENEICVE